MDSRGRVYRTRGDAFTQIATLLGPTGDTSRRFGPAGTPLDDGAIVIETLGPHTLDQLASILARTTTYHLPSSR